MTLFGRTLDGAEIASLVSLLLVLVLWIGAWRGSRSWRDWIKRSPEGQDARRSAGVEGKDAVPPKSSGAQDPLRPWD